MIPGWDPSPRGGYAVGVESVRSGSTVLYIHGVKKIHLTASVVLVLSLALSACSGEDSPTPSTSDSAPSADTTAATGESDTPSKPDPADVALAKSVLLTLNDFPVGWQAKSSDADSKKSQLEIAECMGMDRTELYGDDSLARATTPDFTNEDDEQITQTVVLESDEDAASEYFARFSDEKFRSCATSMMAKHMKDEADADVTVGQVTMNEVNLGGTFGDTSVSFRLEIPMETQGFSLKVMGDFALVRVDRAFLTFTNTRTTFGSSTTEEFVSYVRTGVKRATKSLNKA